jgi:uncharacterized protein YkwD
MKNFEKVYPSIRLIGIFLISAFALSFNLFNKTSAFASTNLTVSNILIEHNKIRKEHSLPPLKINKKLTLSAQLKANEMLKLNCWSHYCPSDKAPWDYMLDANYVFTVAGENLAEGFYDTNALMQAWLNSPTHRENILRADYSEIGIGIVYGDFNKKSNNTLIVVHFGTQVTDKITSEKPANLKILEPSNNEQVDSDFVVKGIAENIKSIDISIDNQKYLTQDILDEIFFINIKNIPTGQHNILVSSSDNLELKDSINIFVRNTADQNNNTANKNQNDPVNIKQSINIGIVLFLLGIFLTDFLILNFTTISDKQFKMKIKHGSLHFGILLVVLLIILTGGLVGHITKEAFII